MKKAKIKAKIGAPVELEMIVSLDEDGEAMIHQVTVLSKSIKIKKLLQSMDEEDSDYIDQLAQEALGWEGDDEEEEEEEEADEDEDEDEDDD
jgi:hypothetical protein